MQTSFNRNENSSRRLDSIVGVLNPLVFSTFTTSSVVFHHMQRVSLGKGANINLKLQPQGWTWALLQRVTHLTAFYCHSLPNDWWAFSLPLFSQRDSLIFTVANRWPTVASLIFRRGTVTHLETPSLPHGPFPIPDVCSYLACVLQAHFPLICQWALQEYKPCLISD